MTIFLRIVDYSSALIHVSTFSLKWCIGGKFEQSITKLNSITRIHFYFILLSIASKHPFCGKIFSNRVHVKYMMCIVVDNDYNEHNERTNIFRQFIMKYYEYTCNIIPAIRIILQICSHISIKASSLNIYVTEQNMVAKRLIIKIYEHSGSTRIRYFLKCIFKKS